MGYFVHIKYVALYRQENDDHKNYDKIFTDKQLASYVAISECI